MVDSAVTAAQGPGMGSPIVGRVMPPEKVANFDPQRLIAARRANGLSHDALGALVGVARSNLIAYEKGRRTPSPVRLAALASALGVDPLELTTTPSVAEATLSDLRLRAAISNAELARRAGISASYLFLVSTGTRPLTASIAQRLAAALDVDVDTLEPAIRREAAARATRRS